MGVIMPIYTVGIIIFFMYTTMKVNPFRDCERRGVREHLFGRGGDILSTGLIRHSILILQV